MLAREVFARLLSKYFVDNSVEVGKVGGIAVVLDEFPIIVVVSSNKQFPVTEQWSEYWQTYLFRSGRRFWPTITSCV